MLNGEVLIPGGGGVFDNVLSVIYDPAFEGGSLSIRAKKVLNGTSISLTLNGDSINSEGKYPLSLHSRFSVVFYDQISNCKFGTYYDNPTSGFLKITKFDKTERIISGTFEFTLTKPGCDTIKVTNGRFDKKL